MNIEGMNGDEVHMLVEGSMNLFSWGERVAVFADCKSDNVTAVEVVSIAAVPRNVTAPRHAIGKHLTGSPAK